MEEKELNSRKIQHYSGLLADCSGHLRTISALIESLAQYTETEITGLIEKQINDVIEEHLQKCSFITEFILVCSESSRQGLMNYIDDLKVTVGFLQEDIEKYQQKIEDLTNPIPPPKPEETNSRLRDIVHKTNLDMFSKLNPFLLRRVEELRKMVSCHDCPPQSLLRTIYSILKLDDLEAVSRIENCFKDKTREQILSDHGLVIILAISNIAGYSGESERSMKGDYRDDDWMFGELLFVENSKFGLVSFPSLVFRAFQHPFIQSALSIENEFERDKFQSSLRYMNDFSRCLNDINENFLLTMDCSSFSSDGRRMLNVDGYFLRVPDIWHVLATLS